MAAALILLHLRGENPKSGRLAGEAGWSSTRGVFDANPFIQAETPIGSQLAPVRFPHFSALKIRQNSASVEGDATSMTAATSQLLVLRAERLQRMNLGCVDCLVGVQREVVIDLQNERDCQPD